MRLRTVIVGATLGAAMWAGIIAATLALAGAVR